MKWLIWFTCCLLALLFGVLCLEHQQRRGTPHPDQGQPLRVEAQCQPDSLANTTCAVAALEV